LADDYTELANEQHTAAEQRHNRDPAVMSNYVALGNAAIRKGGLPGLDAEYTAVVYSLLVEPNFDEAPP
jgi:hypothetical protein